MRISVVVLVVIFSLAAAMSVFAAEVKPGVICTAVVDRACDGIDTMFAGDVGKVYAHTRIVGMESGGAITHRWIYKGKTMAEPVLNIGGPDWRTWSSKNIDPLWSGDWKVEIVDNSDGSVIGTLEFMVKE